MRKLGIILIAVILTSLVGFLVWYFYPRTAPLQDPVFSTDLPFGSGEGLDVPVGQFVEDTSDTAFFNEDGVPRSKIFRITNAPVAGITTYTQDGQSVVRYVDRATGHIYDAVLPDDIGSDAVEVIKVTNITMPKIYEAYFRDNANNVLLRSIDESGSVVNTLASLTPPEDESTELYEIDTDALRGDLGSVAVGSGNNLFYTLDDSQSVVAGAFTNTNFRTIFNSIFTNWKLLTSNNGLLAQTKASAGIDGFLYRVNTSTGGLTKLLGPVSGLSAVPNGPLSRILYSESNGVDTNLFVRNISTGDDAEILPSTLADKCVWSDDNSAVFICGTPNDGVPPGEPDNWYLGISHFSDYIWQFDTASEIALVLVEPNDLENPIDVYKPQLSPDEEYLIFLNKIDLTLWALKLD